VGTLEKETTKKTKVRFDERPSCEEDGKFDSLLDDDQVIRVLSLLRTRSHLLLPLVKKLVALDHVVDDRALGDLLGPELSLRRQVLSVVVSEMVVRRDGERLDSSVDEELGEDGLDLKRRERRKGRKSAT